jgi:hypothetical protein
MTATSTPRSAVCSADDYFVALGRGVYRFEAGQLGAAHAACRVRKTPS